jgi:toxin ParE1/3/4
MNVRWTPPSVDDLTRICDYTALRFGEAQARIAALNIYDAADSLKNIPELGRKGRKSGTRELSVSDMPFIIIYRTGNEAVEILRILHGSQKWP